MYLFNPGTVEVETILAPTLNFVPGRGLRYAIAFDDEPPQIVDALAHNSQADWETSVKDSVRKIQSTHTLATSGYHTLKIWMVDRGSGPAENRCEHGRPEAQLPGPARELSLRELPDSARSLPRFRSSVAGWLRSNLNVPMDSP